ncbi:hypothetical protein [Aquipseudomonas guryensis]|jgi:hypothetical protein|uniref:Uncharacterized protein n=1 Tax=Aquipseudomonas guryensis TaxID=2759165 RepID=A0A7W4H6C4_9GAMM|nr:hypothetical protein [Pseudomonas guryensis]MBB1521202.1 hypothetical protein [Pseudomonas guryensis]
MNTISSHSPVANYVSNIGKSNAASTGTPQEQPATSSSDPVTELRRYAADLVAHSRGGLLRAMQSNASGLVASERAALNSEASGAREKIELPDVAELEREDADKLLAQVQKLVDRGFGESDTFVGYNGTEQTSSLKTYRDWLQAKGGLSVYA